MAVLTKVELTNSTGFPRRYTVASGVAINKGTLLGLQDPRTASGSVTVLMPCAGVANMDKEADDYSTSITAWTDGIFKCECSGAIAAGEPVLIGGADQIIAASGGTVASGAQIIGYALETGADNETIQFRLRI